uniref:CSON006753 protein n=1 Tax=Culicoides sonorensis TaxID=179676 RepID=A0A336KGM7_CULSO
MDFWGIFILVGIVLFGSTFGKLQLESPRTSTTSITNTFNNELDGNLTFNSNFHENNRHNLFSGHDHDIVNTETHESEFIESERRQGRLFESFPFYTIGRFQRQLCTGRNNLYGTCMVKGECIDTGGINSGNCTGLTRNRQAICCVYQQGCGTSTSINNTYFFNTDYPATYNGATTCTYRITRCNTGVCQLRIDMMDFSLAQPSGDGTCIYDYMSVTGGNSRVPRICGENTGQHVYVDFNGDAPITVTIYTSSSFTLQRRWYLRMSQINCDGEYRAPSGCLQYHIDDTGTVKSLNYGVGSNNNLNSIGVEGSRQLANTRYGICVRAGATKCSITWTQASADIYSFTMTDDVGSVDLSLLGTPALQSQACTTDYVIIPNPVQNAVALPSDRFCGLGLDETTSNALPFVLYYVTNGNENTDIGNRGFHLEYSQNNCPLP